MKMLKSRSPRIDTLQAPYIGILRGTLKTPNIACAFVHEICFDLRKARKVILICKISYLIFQINMKIILIYLTIDCIIYQNTYYFPQGYLFFICNFHLERYICWVKLFFRDNTNIWLLVTNLLSK